LEKDAQAEVESLRQAAWNEYLSPMQSEREEAVALMEAVALENPDIDTIPKVTMELKTASTLFRRTIMASARRTAMAVRGREGDAIRQLDKFIQSYGETN